MNIVLGYIGVHWHGLLLSLLCGANVGMIVLAVRGVLHQRAIEKELARMNDPGATVWETRRMLLVIWVDPCLVPSSCLGIRSGPDHADKDGESGRPELQAARSLFRRAGGHRPVREWTCGPIRCCRKSFRFQD
jgi:hypothetical protein